MPLMDLTGKIFAHPHIREQYLEVLHFAERDCSKTWWWCRCACGQVVKRQALLLRRGSTFSCGCLRRRIAQKRGQANKRLHMEEEVVRLRDLDFTFRAIGKLVRASAQHCCAIYHRAKRERTGITP